MQPGGRRRLWYNSIRWCITSAFRDRTTGHWASAQWVKLNQASLSNQAKKATQPYLKFIQISKQTEVRKDGGTHHGAAKQARGSRRYTSCCAHDFPVIRELSYHHVYINAIGRVNKVPTITRRRACQLNDVGDRTSQDLLGMYASPACPGDNLKCS